MRFLKEAFNNNKTTRIEVNMTNSNQTLDDISEKITAGIHMLGGLKHGAEAQFWVA